MPKKTERGDPLGFFNIHSVAKQQKMQGGPFGENFFFRKKSLAVPKKNERGESLVSPGMVCYAEKQEKPFWFSSLDQIVHFDAIIFCRTFVELFWSVRVDRKKRVTIIVAFHLMKRRLKNGTYKNFRSLKVSNISQQKFHNIFERCCQSFKVATFLRSERTFTH